MGALPTKRSTGLSITTVAQTRWTFLIPWPTAPPGSPSTAALHWNTGSIQEVGAFTPIVPEAATPSSGGDVPTLPATQFTAVSEVERNDGSIGTLVIPSLGIRYKAYDGTDSASMRKGVGHFPSTSAWEGNIGLCGHNRGSSHNIGAIKDLEIGDTIRYQTSLGTRTYAVSSVKIIDWTDWSYLNSTSDNRITIITCLANQPTKRVCVQGIEISS